MSGSGETRRPNVHYAVRIGLGRTTGTLCYELAGGDTVTSNAREVTCAKCCALMGRPAPAPKPPAR